MGGVRGDVVQLGFIQTTIMEMGQPPSAPTHDHPTWVKSRQFTGRIVSVSNSRIFTDPVFNYTRDFGYIWEEMAIPVHFDAPCERVESILLAACRGHAVDVAAIDSAELDTLKARFGMTVEDFEPRVYWRITHDWMELTVRFLTPSHGTRDIKDRMSRFVHGEFKSAGIQIAATRYEISRRKVAVPLSNSD